MPKKFNAKPKDPFAALSPEFKDAIRGMSSAEIRERVAQIAIDQANLMKAKKTDKDLAERKLEAEKVGEKYKDGSQLNGLKLKLLPKEQKNEIADLAIAQVDLLDEKADDQELTNAKERLKMASEVYTKGAKIAKLKIKFCKGVLEDKGGA
jgi:hypothetical protein